MRLNTRGFVNYILLPVSGIFYILAFIRRLAYKTGLKKIHSFSTPVIVVGNITVGGSGKTPIVIAICKYLEAKGMKVGVVSRGYKGEHKSGSLEVVDTTKPKLSGDEPLLIKLCTDAVVMVNSNRPQAINDLIEKHNVDVVISDDGMQHYSMDRDIEICVVDGKRRFGNGFYLPAGPLREGVSRLKSVDFVINNGSVHPSEIAAELKPIQFVNIKTGEKKPLDYFHTEYCHAIAGIGHPERFFSTLKGLHIHVDKHKFADHYQYIASDLEFDDNHPIIMTTKDWVKCREFANDKMYYLEVETNISEDFLAKLYDKL